MPDIPVKEISEMFDLASEKLPKMISNILNSLYSAEAGKNMGLAVGNLYKELVENGIPQDEALKMAKDYMLSLKDIASNFSNNNMPNNNG